MNQFGLDSEELKFLKTNLITPFLQNGMEIKIFGSRALNTHQLLSDIDILVAPKNKKTETIVSEVREFFEESMFQYILDIVFEED